MINDVKSVKKRYHIEKINKWVSIGSAIYLGIMGLFCPPLAILGYAGATLCAARAVNKYKTEQLYKNELQTYESDSNTGLEQIITN
ncbi:MAG: hypothetical protein JW791_02915 [Nanoarchaeota archaeon]|nr:hypothetical protein [Nanoarchaeota archaeon]